MLLQRFGKILNRGVPVRYFSIWKDVPQGPPDPILGVTEAFKKDTSPNKVSLGVGAYRDDNGKPWVLESVKKANAALQAKTPDYEYLPTEGFQGFINQALNLAYGKDSKPLQEKRIVGIQALSGTGSLRIGAAFLQRFNKNATLYMPHITWPNHMNIARDAGVPFKTYRYYNDKTRGLDWEGLTADLKSMPEGSVVLLHACAHNPTGVDPKPEQWKELREIFKTKKHMAFFDSAYQGFTSGDVHRDAFSLRHFVEGNVPVILAQSFAKNFGLYGLRTGLFSVVCDKNEFDPVLSQLKILARPMWSNPPLTGARIVETILSTPELNALWEKEIKIMADRIDSMRKSLVAGLKKAGSKHNWNHISDQIGMFAFTGLNPEQVKTVMEKHHVYLTKDGRISIAGLNTKNVDHVAKAFHDATKDAAKF